MKIGNVEIGTSQLSEPPVPFIKTAANTVIILTGIIAVFMAPMPDGWIPIDLKNYILTVSSGLSAFLKVLEKGSSPSKITEQP